MISDAVKNNIEMVIVILFIVFGMGGYYIYLYMEYKKTKDTFEMKRYVGLCPDYWSLTEDSNPTSDLPTIKCKNDKKIGRCNYNTPKDFSTDLYKDDIAKCNTLFPLH